METVIDDHSLQVWPGLREVAVTEEVTTALGTGGLGGLVRGRVGGTCPGGETRQPDSALKGGHVGELVLCQVLGHSEPKSARLALLRITVQFIHIKGDSFLILSSRRERSSALHVFPFIFPPFRLLS